jgi:hypothetical protein
VASKQPDAQDEHTGKFSSGAGKGDKLRRGITQDEWEKKYEKIFGKKEEPVRSHKSNNSSSKS